MRFKQIRPNLTRGYSQTYVCADYVWNKEEKYRTFVFLGREFQRDARAKDMLVLNKSSLGLGT